MYHKSDAFLENIEISSSSNKRMCRINCKRTFQDIIRILRIFTRQQCVRLYYSESIYYRRRLYYIYFFCASNCSMPLRKIKIKVLRRPSTIGAWRAMCQNCMADVSRFNTEYNRVNSKTDATRQKSSRGVNCGYTDFTSSLVVRSARRQFTHVPTNPSCRPVFGA